MTQIIIGGIERNISQVDSYCEYYGGNNKSVGVILDESRADRLVKKILHKKILEQALNIATGNIDLIEIPTIKLENIKELKSKKNAVQKARDIELSYANQARIISDL